MPDLMHGAVVTVEVTFMSVCFGGIIGLFICLCRMSKRRWLNLPALGYIDVVRGTPLMVQILMIYFGLPGLLSQVTGSPVTISGVTAGILACSINSGAYVAEIIRSGIQSIDSGQMEASRSLGLNYAQSMIYIILPQAFRNIIPPMGNEFIVLLKDSSLLSIIGVNELMLQGKLYAASEYAYFPAYLAIAIVYLVMTLSISRIVNLIEKRMKISDKSTQPA
jgi:polar amino acid transport system permease protein